MRKTGEVLGWVDFFIFTRSCFQWSNFGYLIHNRHWGKGYATEASRAAVKFAFTGLKLHRLEACMITDNPRSVRVARKSGFKFEGKRKKFDFDQGKWRNTYVYTLMPEDIGLRSQKPQIK